MRGKNIKGTTGVRKEQYDMKNEILDYLLELMKYKPGMKLPTITYKRIEEYRETCGFDILYKTFKIQTPAIQWALDNKEFKNETAKVNYIFAIIQNNIGAVLLAQEKAKKSEDKTAASDIIPPDIDIHNDFVRKRRDLSAYVED